MYSHTPLEGLANVPVEVAQLTEVVMLPCLHTVKVPFALILTVP